MKKRSKLKKGLAILLSLAMVVGLVPGVGTMKVSAEEEGSATSSTVTFEATAGTAVADENEGYDKLIDGKYSRDDENDWSKWCVVDFQSVADGGAGAYVIFAASQPVSVNGYTIVTGNDNEQEIGRNPKNWTLYGCNDEYANSEDGEDSESWVSIHSVENDTVLEDKNYTSYKYDLDEPTSTKYQYFKLEITETKGSNVMQMSEFILDYNACEHTWEKGGTVAPTCTEEGYTLQTCSKCNEQQKIEIKPALGHDFNDNDTCNRCNSKGVAPSQPAGDGTENSPYQISTAGELYWFAGLVNGTLDGVTQNTSACAVFTADITVNEDVLKPDGTLNSGSFTNWTPIGSNAYPYTGTFDGQNHTVSGLYLDFMDGGCVGLFGLIRGTVKNVGVVDSYFNAYSYVGGVCGQNENGTIENCYNIGTVGGLYYVGGVCGWNYGGTIENCYNTGDVSGLDDVGGVCGYNNSGNLINCYFNSDNYSGGAVGDELFGKHTNVEGKTTAQFENGEVAYLLQSGQTAVNETIPEVWGQTLGTDKYPVLNGTKVYEVNATFCDATTGKAYSNTTEPVASVHKNYNNGLCTCGYCEPAEIINEETSQYKGYYAIENAGQLCWFAGLVNGTLTDGTSQNKSANAVLTADIDLSGIDNWTPIGNSTNKYTGSFDGNNHTIKSMSITEQGNNSGLFGYIDNATIKNIIISGKITITTESYTEGYGSIAGRMDNSTIINCHSSVNITITKDSTIDATGEECIGHIGGIVGKMHEANSAISNCSYSGTIELNDKPVKVAAGIAGYAINSTVPITNCSFTGTIHSTYSGANYIGGIFGYTNTSGEVKVTNCLAVGTITNSGDKSLTGIIIGQINNGYGKNAVKNNYYSSSSSLRVFGTTNGNPSTTPAKDCTTDELNSGKIAYLLSQGENGSVWGQTLGTDNYPVLDSTKKVYQNLTYAGCEGNPGEPVKTEYSNTQLDLVYADHTDEDEDGKCDTCSKYMDNIGARLVGHSLTLDGSVGVNFYMELSSEVISDSSAYMEFTLPGGKTSKVKVSEALTEEISGTTYYKFKCQVNATAMTDTITAQLKSTVGYSKVYEYTVKEYADYLFANKEDNAEFAKAAALIEAMVNYGSYAQIYAGYNTENLAVGDAKNLKSLDDVWITEYYEPSIYETKVQFAGANLSLLSTTTLRMYFKITDVEAEIVSIGYQGQLLEMKQSGDYYYVELVGIPASNLDDEFCIDVNDGSTIFQVTYSPMVYCANVVNRETIGTRTESLKNLIKALVLYNQAADAYISGN